MLVVSGISIVGAVGINSGRVRSSFYASLAVIVSRDKIEIGRSRANQWHKSAAQSACACEDARGFEGAPEAVGFAAEDEGVVSGNHAVF